MKTCSICFEEKNIFGFSCPTCRNNCCISCESRIQNNCPFCRGNLLSWGERLVKSSEEQKDYYLNEIISTRKKNIERYNYLHNLYFKIWDLISLEDEFSIHVWTEYMEILLEENLSDEDLLQLLYFSTELIYDIARKRSDEIPLEEWISFILEFVQIVYQKINSDRLVRNFSIDMEEIESILNGEEDFCNYKQTFVKITKKLIKIFSNFPIWKRGAKDYTRMINYCN